MDKQKASKELGEMLYKNWHEKDFWVSRTDFYKISDIAIENGYGNISQALTDFVNKLNEIIEKYVINVYSDFDTERYAIITSLINATLKEFKNEYKI